MLNLHVLIKHVTLSLSRRHIVCVSCGCVDILDSLRSLSRALILVCVIWWLYKLSMFLGAAITLYYACAFFTRSVALSLSALRCSLLGIMLNVARSVVFAHIEIFYNELIVLLLSYIDRAILIYS